MLTRSDLIWTGRRWEVRTAEGFVGLDEALEGLREQLARVAAERDAAVDDLTGFCWACAHGEPAKIGAGGLTTCDHMRALGTLARGGRSKCKHWQWRGPREDNKEMEQ